MFSTQSRTKPPGKHFLQIRQCFLSIQGVIAPHQPQWMSSANNFNLDKAKILRSGNEWSRPWCNWQILSNLQTTENAYRNIIYAELWIFFSDAFCHSVNMQFACNAAGTCKLDKFSEKLAIILSTNIPFFKFPINCMLMLIAVKNTFLFTINQLLLIYPTVIPSHDNQDGPIRTWETHFLWHFPKTMPILVQ